MWFVPSIARVILTQLRQNTNVTDDNIVTTKRKLLVCRDFGSLCHSETTFSRGQESPEQARCIMT